MRKKMRSGSIRAAAAIVMVVAMLFATVGPANAVETRPGAKWGQYDLMLSAYETEQARRSFWAATVICWDSGLAGKAMSLGLCQSMVSVCAAQAYYASPRKRAGITFGIGSAWCWKY